MNLAQLCLRTAVVLGFIGFSMGFGMGGWCLGLRNAENGLRPMVAEARYCLSPMTRTP